MNETKDTYEIEGFEIPMSYYEDAVGEASLVYDEEECRGCRFLSLPGSYWEFGYEGIECSNGFELNACGCWRNREHETERNDEFLRAVGAAKYLDTVDLPDCEEWQEREERIARIFRIAEQTNLTIEIC